MASDSEPSVPYVIFNDQFLAAEENHLDSLKPMADLPEAASTPPSSTWTAGPVRCRRHLPNKIKGLRRRAGRFSLHV